MRIIRCMSCEAAHRRPTYWHERVWETDQARPVFSDSTVYESGTLRYCGNCLIHAQLILTDLLGYERVNQVLNSDLKNRLKDFGTPNPSHPNLIKWHYTLTAIMVGKANHE